MRKDLLSLTEEDLIAFTNRGAYKRSVKELDLEKVSCEMTEDGETVIFNWSDEAICTLPPNSAFSEDMCTCASTKICRHLVRSVLYYQNNCEGSEEEIVEDGPWSPAHFTDEQIKGAFDSKAISRQKKLFDSGLTIELFTGKKPMAYIHEFSVSVRFLAKDSLHLTQCNCEETSPCSHVLLANWAFREMPQGKDVFLYWTTHILNIIYWTTHILNIVYFIRSFP